MRDLGRLVGRERDSSAIWADPGVLELLPLLALKREAAAVGLVAATDNLRSGPTLTARRRAARAALAAASAIASADVDQALAAASQLDETAAAIDAAARRPNGGHVEAAALLCVRADFLIG